MFDYFTSLPPLLLLLRFDLSSGFLALPLRRHPDLPLLLPLLLLLLFICISHVLQILLPCLLLKYLPNAKRLAPLSNSLCLCFFCNLLQLYWPASPDRVQECLMAGKDPEVIQHTETQ